jgi:hypothetical protein
MIRFSIALASALGVIATPAAAQTRTSGPTASAAEMRQVHARFGDCVVKKHHAAARAYVLTPDMGADDRPLERLADGNCLLAATSGVRARVQMRFPADTMRYALAEALVRRDALAPAAVANAAPLVQPTFDAARYEPKAGRTMKPAELASLEEQRTKRLATVYVAAYGECVVRTDPAGAHALLRTEPESAAEAAAIGALRPALGNCLPDGQTLSFGKFIIRGTVAMNFYRLANAPRVAARPAGMSK